MPSFWLCVGNLQGWHNHCASAVRMERPTEERSKLALPWAGTRRAQVVKVLHGADSDVVWLQRDFGVFIANMFDTGQASRVLQLPSHGLAHLLAHFCDVKARDPAGRAQCGLPPAGASAQEAPSSGFHSCLLLRRAQERPPSKAQRLLAMTFVKTHEA